MSFREMDILDLLDVSFGPLSTTLPSSPQSVCDSGSGSFHGDSPGGWAENKWLVNESKLMELFKRCSIGGCAIVDRQVTSKSSQIKMLWTCLNGHLDSWASCPDWRGMTENKPIHSRLGSTTQFKNSKASAVLCFSVDLPYSCHSVWIPRPTWKHHGATHLRNDIWKEDWTL